MRITDRIASVAPTTGEQMQGLAYVEGVAAGCAKAGRDADSNTEIVGREAVDDTTVHQLVCGSSANTEWKGRCMMFH